MFFRNASFFSLKVKVKVKLSLSIKDDAVDQLGLPEVHLYTLVTSTLDAGD
jgi:hypothetical protein